MKERIAGEVVTRNKLYSIRIERVGSYTYVGTATVGSATSAGVWQIRRITNTGAGFNIQYADGDTDYDNIWDNRGSLSYS